MPPGTTPPRSGGALHPQPPRLTKAGDWFEARKAGKRLPEHVLDTDATDLEDLIYAHGQEATL